MHGSLQGPRVWQQFEGSFSYRGKPLSIQAEDLRTTTADSFSAWAKDFCKKVQDRSQGEESFLLAYSLGGRLAMHALLEKPSLWKGAVIVAAHPGLSSSEEKSKRLKVDKSWLQKFTNEPLEQVLKDWDELPTFTGFKNQAPREVDDFSKPWVSKSFDTFSTGRQEHLLPKLKTLSMPILYIAGAKDKKYADLGVELERACPGISFKEVSEAGHRVPWEAGDVFVSKVQDFMDYFSQ